MTTEEVMSIFVITHQPVMLPMNCGFDIINSEWLHILTEKNIISGTLKYNIHITKEDAKRIYTHLSNLLMRMIGTTKIISQGLKDNLFPAIKGPHDEIRSFRLWQIGHLNDIVISHEDWLPLKSSVAIVNGSDRKKNKLIDE